MAENKRSSKSTWIIIAIVAIVIALFAGLLPLPGQKDNVTPSTQPSPPGTQPQVEAPTGPPPSPMADPGAGGTNPPTGRNAAAVAGRSSGQHVESDHDGRLAEARSEIEFSCVDALTLSRSRASVVRALATVPAQTSSCAAALDPS